MTVWKHVIGILGGMGPHAHLEMERLLLEATEKALGRPARDQDYPPWVVSSLPATPDRTRALLEGGESPLEAMVMSASRLEDASFAVVACNTAHAFLDELQGRVSIPLLDMVRLTAERALERVGSRGTVGILATTGTLRSGLYAKSIRELSPSARVVSPLDLEGGEDLQERLVMEPIFGKLEGNDRRAGGGIKSGAYRHPRRREELAAPLREAARRLRNEGAGIVLTACTEIPLVLEAQTAGDVPLLDSMSVAAEAAIEIALGRRPLPLVAAAPR